MKQLYTLRLSVAGVALCAALASSPCLSIAHADTVRSSLGSSTKLPPSSGQLRSVIVANDPKKPVPKDPSGSQTVTPVIPSVPVATNPSKTPPKDPSGSQTVTPVIPSVPVATNPSKTPPKDPSGSQTVTPVIPSVPVATNPDKTPPKDPSADHPVTPDQCKEQADWFECDIASVSENSKSVVITCADETGDRVKIAVSTADASFAQPFFDVAQAALDSGRSMLILQDVSSGSTCTRVPGCAVGVCSRAVGFGLTQ